jgi:outer membrane protein TolC
MNAKWIVFLMAGFSAFAQTQPARPAPLSLQDYLNQVMTQNPEARAKKEALTKAELRMNEAEVPLSPNLYATYDYKDDRVEPTNPIAPAHSIGSVWKAGVKDQTKFGLGTDFYVSSSHVNLYGGNPQFIPLNDYYQNIAGVELTQSLWRNSFGESTRAQYALQKAKNRMDAFQAKFDLKNIQLKAENAYWSVATLNQIVKLQEENVDRARRLTAFMNKRVKMRLVDDVDGLQVQASQETRELELQTSLDERASAVRQFNTLRGVANDDVGELSDLPDSDAMLKEVKDSSKRMSREDFRAIFEKARIDEEEARGARSMIAPQLDLRAGVATNGLNNPHGTPASAAWSELEHGNNPTWHVGFTFSVPLDYTLIHDMSRSYKSAQKSAESMKEYAEFAEERAWHDLLQQKLEAQRRFERSLRLEKTQTELVKRERARLMAGRSTTLQTTTIEQNYASAQIQRVRSQLALLQVHNLLKQWGEKE